MHNRADNHPNQGYLRDEAGTWHDRQGTTLQTTAELARLRQLAIPPAWTNVWASADPDTAVQATGMDQRGRTQYRYSAQASARAASDKFAHVLDFARELPRIRFEVSGDLGRAAMRRPIDLGTATAAIVRLLDLGLFRVGNDRYERDNHTYGLTTLIRADATVRLDSVVFDYVGKEHRRHVTTVTDHDTAHVLRRLLRRPASSADPLFVLQTLHGSRHITSGDVNAYLHAHSHAPATAKMFRTWGATAAAAAVLGGAEPPVQHASRGLDGRAVATAAELLGDTRPVTRASYVHPGIFDPAIGAALRDGVDAAAAITGTVDALLIMRDPTFQSTLAAALTDLLRR